MKINANKILLIFLIQMKKIIRPVSNLPYRCWNWFALKIIRPNVLPGFTIGAFVLSVILVMWISPKFLKPALLIAKQYHFWHMKTDSLWLISETELLNKQIHVLNSKLNSFIPKTPYLIINSTENKFFLYKNGKLVREGKCSTGSYLQLEQGENQKWLFKTPKGEFKIRNKKTDPVWKKPDWAFIEEGLPVPSPNHSSRYEYGVLGDYALSLGDGYMIHGTIWQRYLGLPITHGCVRLNDADLEAVYKTLSIGSKVYIF